VGREIKFRAWVSQKDNFQINYALKESNMYRGFSFEDVGSGRDEATTYCDDSNNWEEPKWDKAILMQYTGIKDKKSKEIYEGDIVKHKNGIKEVKYIEETYSFDMGLSDNVSDQECNIDPNTIEVIGNIYEHPELLKEE
jgi:uncharacterized phage protein (TIGR01671 family)